MKRMIEWLLAAIGATLCIGGAASIWIPQAETNPPGFSMWPMPALILIEVALLGIAGLLGIAYEPNQAASRWSILVWIACGGLLGLAILGELSVSIIAFLGVPAAFFGGAAIMSEGRRKRKMLPDLGILVLSGIVTFGLLYAYIIIG